MTCKQSTEPAFIMDSHAALREQLQRLLLCGLCSGLVRVAVALPCDHGFCKICIVRYISEFRGLRPSLKCPTCKRQFTSELGKSIFLDEARQCFSDMLSKASSLEERTLVRRVSELFGDPAIQEEIYSGRINLAGFLQSSFTQEVRRKFDLSLQNFREALLDDRLFQQMRQAKAMDSAAEVVLTLGPRSAYDQKYVGLRGQLRIRANLALSKICQLIQKQLLGYIQASGKIPAHIINFRSNHIATNIRLFAGDEQLNPDTLCGELAIEQMSIEYALR